MTQKYCLSVVTDEKKIVFESLKNQHVVSIKVFLLPFPSPPALPLFVQICALDSFRIISSRFRP